ILAIVVRQLLFVGQVSIATVKTLREQKQSADAISVVGEIRGMLELIGVSFWVIGPDMFDLVAILSFSDKFQIPRRQTRRRLNIVRHPRKETMQHITILLVK